MLRTMINKIHKVIKHANSRLRDSELFGESRNLEFSCLPFGHFSLRPTMEYTTYNQVRLIIVKVRYLRDLRVLSNLRVL